MDVSERLKSLSKMDKPALYTIWRELFKEAVPARVRRELLIRILSYRLQEQAFGGLSPATRKRLRQIAAQLESGKANPTAEPQRIKPGTRLIRAWRQNPNCERCPDEYEGSHL